MPQYDVIIVGAGVAGLTAASSLARHGVSVLIVDSEAKGGFKTGECLMADALPVMEKLGLKQPFLNADHRSLQSYRVSWGQQNSYERHLLTHPMGAGWIVNREVFDDMLLNHCQLHNAEIRWQSALHQVERSASGEWLLHFKEGKDVLSAKFIIDASGRARAFTRRINVPKTQIDKLVASCCHVQTDCELSANQATIASDKHGWWYYAKYTKTHGNLCYFSDADLPRPSSPQHLLDSAMQQPSLARLLSDSVPVSTTFKRYAAYSSALQDCIGEDWLAIGDAAVSFDPLSSYGMTSALSSAFYASKAILRYFNHTPQFLQTYQQLIQQNFLSYLDKHNQEYEKVRAENSEFWMRRQSNQAA